VTISHGRLAKLLSRRQNTEGNGHTNPAADQGKKNTATERLTFTPSSLLISEGEATTPMVEPEATAESWPEPGPDWSKAFGEWGAAWEFHVYFFALIFLGFAVYATYFIGQGLYVGLNQKYLGFCLNVVMLILGFTRALILFADPYHQGDIIENELVMRVLWSLGSPCLTSADCLVILALVETVKISLAPPKMQKLNFVLAIIMVHFTYVLVTDFVVSAHVEEKAMLVACQWFFIVWGAILGVGYFVLGYKIDQKLFGHKEIKSKKEVLYIRLIFASGVNNFVLCAVFIFASVSHVYSHVKFVDAWTWWAVQTCSRVTEVSSGILIFTVSAKRKSLKRETNYTAKDESELDDASMSSTQQETGSVESRRIQDRALSMFSELHAKKKAAENQVKNEVLEPTIEEDSNNNMLTDLHQAKIETYYANEDVGEMSTLESFLKSTNSCI